MMARRGTYAMHLSYAQACVVRDLWHQRWSVAEIASFLSVDPIRVDTGRADDLERGHA